MLWYHMVGTLQHDKVWYSTRYGMAHEGYNIVMVLYSIVYSMIRYDTIHDTGCYLVISNILQYTRLAPV